MPARGVVVTTYRRVETVVRRVEFAVAAGSNVADANKVQEMAWHNYCQRTGTDPDGSRHDDWCRVDVGDDEVVFAFEVEHKPDAAEQAVVRAREALTALCERWAGKSGRLDAEDFNLVSDALGGAGMA
jgi:hypothetical protein